MSKNTTTLNKFDKALTDIAIKAFLAGLLLGASVAVVGLLLAVAIR